jgi:uncharacterized protein YoxC
MEVERAMSKDLSESAAELERKAERQVMEIRRAVREYNEAAQNTARSDTLEQTRKQSEIEHAVAKYVQLHKAIRRLRKKMRAGK